MIFSANMDHKYQKLPLIAVVFTVLVKTLFLLTNHIQEDAFITWRVAQNLMDYGVIGFNGDTKISASTTHLYVFISYIFNFILGKDNFIYPILIFNSILFTIGSYFLSKLLFKDFLLQAFFIVLLGLVPPAVKISILGMEYGILFFLEMSLLYFGFSQRKKWAWIVFSILILFTRLDTVIFLGIVFIVDVIKSRKINWYYVLGGALGVILLVAFNWFYFGELVNNTIVAKKNAYKETYTLGQQLNLMLYNFGNFWGMLKLPSSFNPFTIIVLAFELVCFVFLVRQQKERNFYLWVVFLYGWAQQFIFLSQRSYFDWYYWIPQLLLFVPILVFILEQKQKKAVWITLFVGIYMLPMLAYQIVHSIATGNGEWNYRKSIGVFLDKREKDKSQWIFLEPAGYIPYYSHLKTIDEVGLVDKGVQSEIAKDPVNFRLNVAKNRQPKYILAYEDLYESRDAAYYKEHYKEIKKFRISDFLHSDNKLLEKIYKLKPSGTDYNLYERIK